MSYSIRPEEHELRKARHIVEGALETCKTAEEKQEDFEVCLGAKSKDNYPERGAFGEAWNQNLIRIYFNTFHGDNWEQDLKTIVCAAYAESLFMERSEINFAWQSLIKKAFSLKFIERAGIEEPEKDTEAAGKAWNELKDKLDTEEKLSIDWSLASIIGDKLLEQYGLEDFPELKRSDIIEAGDKLFGDGV